jgi:hypothetical protein
MMIDITIGMIIGWLLALLIIDVRTINGQMRGNQLKHVPFDEGFWF